MFITSLALQPVKVFFLVLFKSIPFKIVCKIGKKFVILPFSVC